MTCYQVLSERITPSLSKDWRWVWSLLIGESSPRWLERVPFLRQSWKQAADPPCRGKWSSLGLCSTSVSGSVMVGGCSSHLLEQPRARHEQHLGLNISRALLPAPRGTSHLTGAVRPERADARTRGRGAVRGTGHEHGQAETSGDQEPSEPLVVDILKQKVLQV